ncbi:MAG: DNA topoisomerase [Eubacteriales bacterium]|nr:DNA topoisomerase [Eubacteriales bacterium]
MGKSVYIAEKPSVAQEFAKALHVNFQRKDGYLEGGDHIVTWCVGHLVTMSYPDAYDPNLKRWSFDTLPFIPKEFKYEVIPAVQKQFDIVKGLLNREDVETIYVCTDSGREGEYIYRLVRQEAEVTNKEERRVWIDSQTEEEILKGIKTAKDLSEYNNLSDAAYLRAKEDYLMGINFSRVLTLKYGRNIANYLHVDRTVVSVGRVMTCVLGMVVRREREIRSFVKTPFYRVLGKCQVEGGSFDAEWRVNEKSRYFGTPYLYKDNGFKDREKAEELVGILSDPIPCIGVVKSIERKKETKNPPLLFNLAEIQNECSKLFKISPDQTLNIIQELYEKKLVTYPRTDARVLSTAVCKEIHKNLGGLRNYEPAKEYAEQILNNNMHTGIAKTRYCNDKAITDHYAIIPTGQGFNNLASLSSTSQKTYEIIVRRFLSIFYLPAVYQKVTITSTVKDEDMYASFKVLAEEGYLKVTRNSFAKAKNEDSKEGAGGEESCDNTLFETLKKYRKGSSINFTEFTIKEGETSPPKRYNSGSIILAMENAGQLIEDEELRAQIKGSGIGTSATRAEILKKLNTNKYIATNNKTQIITPTLLGEIIYDVVDNSIKQLLNPELTASWEKGLTYVAEGSITADEYMEKLSGFVGRRTQAVKGLKNQSQLVSLFNESAKNYK